MNGIILVNKEKDYTSHDVVAIVKKTLNEKVGHTGTLDPNATGILPLLVGDGTKLSKYLINHDKIYTAVLKLGIKTDTADITGNIIQEENVPKLDEKQIEKVLELQLGEQEQLPPMYSAIKINGKKLYEYARQGKSVEVASRKINIYNAVLEKYDYENNEITFTVECSKGTYIRTLCEEIAKSLNTIGTMRELHRVKVGEFCVENAITISELKENATNEKWLKKHIITIEQLLENKQKLVLNVEKLEKFLNGVKLNVKSISQLEISNGICLVYDETKKFIGTGVIEEGKLKRDVILSH